MVMGKSKKMSHVVHKVIKVVLDFVLIVGALAAIVTIDGGSWLTTLLSYYQPAGGVVGYMDYNASAIVQAEAISSPDISLEREPECITLKFPSFKNWEDVGKWFTSIIPMKADIEPELPVRESMVCR